MPWKAKAQFLTPQVFKFIRNFIRFNSTFKFFSCKHTLSIHLNTIKIRGEKLLEKELERLSLYENCLKNKSK